MVFMRPRRSEQRHDAVALDLVDDAVIAMHRLFHEIEHGLEPLHPEFGIAQAVDQAGRVSDVGKQQRQILAFTALGAERAKQLAWRGIGAARSLGERHPAMAAEPARRSVDRLAGLAFEAKRRAAAFAKAVLRSVQAAALLALHGQSFADRPPGFNFPCRAIPSAQSPRL